MGSLLLDRRNNEPPHFSSDFCFKMQRSFYFVTNISIRHFPIKSQIVYLTLPWLC
jgi:hypothetical protein